MTSNTATVPIASDPRYPIGRFAPPEPITETDRLAAISVLAELPARLRAAVAHLDGAQLDTPYRDGGWTVRQVIHHLADSHMVAFLRVKLALTAQEPPAIAYDEKAWAERADYNAPVESSLRLIEGLQARWVLLLRSLTPAEWERPVPHPRGGLMTIERLTLLYAWHSQHHTAHITHLAARENW